MARDEAGLRDIVSSWPADDVRALSPQLSTIAIHGDRGSDLLALRLLAQHGIGDPQLVADRLEFKRQHHEKRLSEIAEIVRLFDERRTL